MYKFWSLQVRSEEKRTDLYIMDEIAARESWWSDSVTPRAFKRELDRAEGTLYVWIDSPGGDAFAGNAIHDLLREYSASGRGKVIAMVSLAASAASVIAMAADEIRISILGTIMIHEPWSQPTGRSEVLRAVADVLDTVRDAQVEAYARRTGQTAEKILELLRGTDGSGTYMNARQALELGFADSIMHDDGESVDAKPTAFMKSLTVMRIAASIERDGQRLQAMELEPVKTRKRRVSDPIADGVSVHFQEIDTGAIALKFLRELAGQVDAAGSDLSEAIAVGIQAGLNRWEALLKGGGDGRGTDEDGAAEGEPAAGDRDDGIEALLAAIEAIGEMEDDEHGDDD